jgi:hypothetical protein
MPDMSSDNSKRREEEENIPKEREERESIKKAQDPSLEFLEKAYSKSQIDTAEVVQEDPSVREFLEKAYSKSQIDTAEVVQEDPSVREFLEKAYSKSQIDTAEVKKHISETEKSGLTFDQAQFYDDEVRIQEARK